MNPRWILVGSLIAWFTLLAPPITVFSWLNSWSLTLPLFLSLLASPLVLVIVMRKLQATRSRSKWYLLQYLGLGAILLPVVMAGAVLRLFLDAPIVAMLAILVWLILIPIAWRNGRTIHNKHLTIQSNKINKPIKLVQISDVHVGSRSAKYLDKVVTQVQANKPDLVFITGDLLDSSLVDTQQLASLKTLTCPTYMCIGNHERYVNLNAAIAAIEANNVTILRDASITHGPLHIAGIDDRDIPEAIPAVVNTVGHDPNRFNIALYHRPDGWAATQQHFELTLAGHTHAGQLWPFGYFVKRKYPQMVGLFQRDGHALYVSPGAGTWGPVFRLGTRCEMTVIDLVSN